LCVLKRLAAAESSAVADFPLNIGGGIFLCGRCYKCCNCKSAPFSTISTFGENSDENEMAKMANFRFSSQNVHKGRQIRQRRKGFPTITGKTGLDNCGKNPKRANLAQQFPVFPAAGGGCRSS
jgi:hypothetical protein